MKDASIAVGAARGFARWGLHLLFWLVFLVIDLFMELYFSSSFQSHPDWTLFAQAAVLQLLLLVVKAGAVYYLLYLFLPRWSSVGRRALLLLEAVGVLLLAVVLCRVVIQYVGWRLIYDEVPVGVTPLGFFARYMYSLLDLLEISGVAFTLKLLRLRIAADRRERELLRQKLDSEMQLLRAQTQPHFLFNSLNSIYALARQGASETPEAVMRLSQILRYVLYESAKPLIPLSRELSLIEDYVDLQRLRFGERVKVEMDLQLEDEELPIAPMMIFPLVENAFKHGTAPDADGSVIEVGVKVSGKVLHARVRNRIWQQSVPEQGREGIGLKGLQRLLSLLYGNASLHTQEADGFFTVDLQIDTSHHAGTSLPDR